MLRLFKSLLSRKNLVTAGLFTCPLAFGYSLRPHWGTIVFVTVLFALTYLSESVRHWQRENLAARLHLVEGRRLQQPQTDAEQPICVE